MTAMTNSDEHWSPDDLFTVATEGIALTTVSTLGLVGNCMSIYVLARMIHKEEKGSFSVLLLGLACFDALFLLTAILAFGMTKLSSWYSSLVFPHIMAALFGLVHTFRVGSVYAILSINIERFCAIVFPLKYFTWKKYLLPMTIATAILYNLPKYFEMEMRFDPTTNTTELFETAMRRNQLYVFFYVVWSKILLMELLPYCIVIVCNVFIITKITKSAKFRGNFLPSGRIDDGNAPSGALLNDQCDPTGRSQRQSFRRKQKEEQHLGLILVLMSILFIVCQSFKIVPDLYELVFCGPSKANCDEMTEGGINVVLRLSHLLACVNSATNFLVYYLSGRKFRTAWTETYGCRSSAAPAGDNFVMAPKDNDAP